ncbi:LPP20 family lipoprotein [Celerinatantimonas sp. YJH-8]|uniref:LPP20 family lipoprotein n=1 Tax=Celerinatantimonas sp. YJH-8 TaxID=3228714 RepID=UPI0038BFDB17
MKTRLSALLISAGVLVITGCSQKTTLDYSECDYPDAPSHSAPGWVCEQPVKGLELQAVGYSRKLLSGPGMMTDVAATEARNRLAAQFSQLIQGRLQRLTTDNKSDQQVTGKDAVSTSALNSRDNVERIQKSLSAMTLENSKIYRTQISPSGGMYVLVGMDKQHYDANVNQLVNNALTKKDSPELYQQFLKAQADESLDKVRQQLN